MRVCVLMPALDVFKGGNHLPLLAALKDVRFTIVTNRVKPRDIELPANVEVQTLGERIGPYYYGIADYLYARALLRRHPPRDVFWKQFDVIHINQAMGPALSRLRETGVPVCFFIHHPVSADRTIVLEESSGFERLRWRLKYAFLVRWQKRLCRAFPHIVTVSHTAADRIARDYGCERSKVHVVPNGVDTEVFAPGDLSQSEFDVTALGAFVHPRKGFRYLLEVYRALSAHGLRIADAVRRSPEQMQALRAIPGVQVLGTVPEERLLSLLRQSSVLVSTSLYEGFGLSLVEALACGRPAVAFDGGAVREVLEPIDPSLVVALRDTGALADRVL